MTICHSCKYDLRKVAKRGSIHNACAKEVELQGTLIDVLHQGQIKLQDGEIVKSSDFFSTLRQLMAMMRRIWNANINIAISKCSGIEPLNLRSIASIKLEFLDARNRLRLLNMAYYLLEDWPNRCLKICKDNTIWSSMLIPSNKKSLMPQWYRKIISEHLFNPKYQSALVQEKFGFLPIARQQPSFGNNFYINPIESSEEKQVCTSSKHGHGISRRILHLYRLYADILRRNQFKLSRRDLLFCYKAQPTQTTMMR
ncbi:MAG: hypothetical protein WBP93_09535 [Pyrinomonadaceae bacterium]